MNDVTEKLLGQREVSQLTGLGRIAIWRLEKDGRFPDRRRVSPGKIGWLASEIDSWIKARPKAKALQGNEENA